MNVVAVIVLVEVACYEQLCWSDEWQLKTAEQVLCLNASERTRLSRRVFFFFSSGEVCSRDTNRERGREAFSKRPPSGGTYSGACTRPCSTPLSRNCCGCRHSPRIWSAHTSSGSSRSASGAWRPDRGRSRPPGCTRLPEGGWGKSC